MGRVREAATAGMCSRLAAEVARPEVLRPIVSIGIPVLLPDGRLLRGPECKIPPVTTEGDSVEITREGVESWANAGWVDLREANMALWKERFETIAREIESIPSAETSSRYLRDRQFWSAEGLIQPGKVVGWVFATEGGARMK
jgi:hypothetical protein